MLVNQETCDIRAWVFGKSQRRHENCNKKYNDKSYGKEFQSGLIMILIESEQERRFLMVYEQSCLLSPVETPFAAEDGYLRWSWQCCGISLVKKMKYRSFWRFVIRLNWSRTKFDVDGREERFEDQKWAGAARWPLVVRSSIGGIAQKVVIVAGVPTVRRLTWNWVPAETLSRTRRIVEGVKTRRCQFVDLGTPLGWIVVEKHGEHTRSVQVFSPIRPQRLSCSTGEYWGVLCRVTLPVKKTL